MINSPFALRQQNLKPVFTQIETTERPYTDSEINDLMSKQVERDKRVGLKDNKIKHHCFIYLKLLKEHNNKIEDKKDYPIDLHTLERIIITPNAKGYISTAFLEFAKKYSIPIYWIDGNGMIESCFMPVYFKRTSLIIKQCESRINGKNIKIAKYLIKLKLESEGMEHLIPKLDKAKNIKDILQIEGNASRAYYQQWSFSDEWNWNGRHGKTSINANAIDPINSILNLGYSLLAQHMSEILLKRGFELSIGFMHNSG